MQGHNINIENNIIPCCFNKKEFKGSEVCLCCGLVACINHPTKKNDYY